MSSRACSVGLAIAPVDVILDRERALVLQPDVLFVATERLGIIRDQVWAPDLVVEGPSPGTERRDRAQKLEWFRQYGVRECWLVDPRQELVTVVDLTARFRANARPRAATRFNRRSCRGSRQPFSSSAPGSDLDFRFSGVGPGLQVLRGRTWTSGPTPGDNLARPVPV